MSYRTAVSRSCRTMEKPPSPTRHTTGRLGQANLAPIAAGNPNPKHPPAGAINDPGSVNPKYRVTHGPNVAVSQTIIASFGNILCKTRITFPENTLPLSSSPNGNFDSTLNFAKAFPASGLGILR